MGDVPVSRHEEPKPISPHTVVSTLSCSEAAAAPGLEPLPRPGTPVLLRLPSDRGSDDKQHKNC